MNPKAERAKRALIASGATLAFIAILVVAPLLAVLVFLIAYLSDE